MLTITLDAAPGGQTDVAMIRLAGELDQEAETQIRTCGAKLLDDLPVREIAIQMADVTFLDCAGLAALVCLRNGALARGGDVHVVDAPPPIVRLLRVAGLAEPFGIDPPPPPERADEPVRRPWHVVGKLSARCLAATRRLSSVGRATHS